MNDFENKLHILVVVRWPVGGIRTFLRYVYGKFPPDRYRFTFILPDLDEVEVIRQSLSGQDSRYILLPSHPTNFQFVKAIFRAVQSESIDIVHSHGFTSGLHSAICAWPARVPHLMTSHDVFTTKQFHGLAGIVKRVGMTAIFQKINAIHCVSNDARKNLLSYLPGLDRRADTIVAIPNGIDTGRFLTEEREDLRQITSLTPKDFLIGFFGRFMAQKGFRYLVDAMEILRDRSLPRKPRVLCFGWGGFIREEQAMLASRGLDDLFFFLPFRENIAPTIRGMDVVVMPSLWEAYGLLAAETLVAGTPLIGSQCTGLKEIMQGTPAQAVPPGDAYALADAIALETKESTNNKASEYRKIAAKRFDASHQVVALEKLLISIAYRSSTRKTSKWHTI